MYFDEINVIFNKGLKGQNVFFTGNRVAIILKRKWDINPEPSPKTQNQSSRI